MYGFLGGGVVGTSTTLRLPTATRQRRPVRFVAVAASDTTKEVAEVQKKGFYTGVPLEAVDLMSVLRCHKSILGRNGFSSAQAQLFTKIDTANDWISDAEYETNKSVLPGFSTANKMKHDIESITSAASRAVRARFPNVEDKDLAILEFDLRYNILRILSYGISAHCSSEFLHKTNVLLYKKMFEEVGLPKDAFLLAIGAAKTEAVKIADPGDKLVVEETFDYLMSIL